MIFTMQACHSILLSLWYRIPAFIWGCIVTIYPSERPAVAVYEWIQLSLEASGDIKSRQRLLKHSLISVLVHLFMGVHNHVMCYKGRQRGCITDPPLKLYNSKHHHPQSPGQTLQIYWWKAKFLPEHMLTPMCLNSQCVVCKNTCKISPQLWEQTR